MVSSDEGRLRVNIATTVSNLKWAGKQIWETEDPPEIAGVLGSGLGGLVSKLEGDKISLDFNELPHFPRVSIAGHAGKVWLGTLGGKRVLLQAGRGHCYEGTPIDQVVHPVRSYVAWGVKTLIVTNAAGAVNLDYKVGDLMVIRDHISFLSNVNPLLGPNDSRIGPRFPPMAGAYQAKVQYIMETLCRDKSLDIRMRGGVYCMAPGPCYETAAEIRMLRVLGVDAVGMSTVPEVIAARHMGLENIIGFSLITNLGGRSDLDHAHVEAEGKKAAAAFEPLMVEFVRQLPTPS